MNEIADMKSERLLDVPVHVADYKAVALTVEEWISRKKRPAAYIIQANVFSLVNAKENSAYHTVLLDADLLVPDGMPLVWLLKKKGHALSDRVYGPDMMLCLCDKAAQLGWRCFLLGGTPETLGRLKEKLTSRFPGLSVVGTYSPPFRPLTQDEKEKMCQEINVTKPDILWVGLGSTKQDMWMYEHQKKLDVSVLHGVGAAFDFISGRIPQAPQWMMKAGLEWLFRFMHEPRRLWKRYTITNVKFLYYLCLAAFHKRK